MGDPGSLTKVPRLSDSKWCCTVFPDSKVNSVGRRVTNSRTVNGRTKVFVK